MPVVKPPQSSLEYSRYSLWGEYFNTTGYVLHVGLCKESGNSLSKDGSLAVYHMRPPLIDEVFRVNKHFFLVPCAWSVEQREKMDYFVADTFQMMGEQRLSCSNEFYFYCVYPHRRTFIENNRVMRQYSCVGFVLEAFSAADIKLFQTNSPKLPKVSQKRLIELFTPYRELFNSSAAAFFENYERGEWPVVLPGYAVQGLLHREQDGNVDFCPAEGDELLQD